MRRIILGFFAILIFGLGAYHWRRLAVLPYGYSPARCRVISYCADLAYIDCGAAADGPADYVKTWTGSLVSHCGGACMVGCTQCPPDAWTCR